MQPGETQVTERDAAHWVSHTGNMYRDGHLWKGTEHQSMSLASHITLCTFHLSLLTDDQGLLFPLKTALLFRGLVGN